MEKKDKNLALHNEIKNLTNKLPEELREKYKIYSHKNSAIIEQLKVAAVLKFWNDRGVRDIKFDVPIVFGNKTVFVKVLAKHAQRARCLGLSVPQRLSWVGLGSGLRCCRRVCPYTVTCLRFP